MAIRFKINEEGRFTAADVSDVVCRAGICTGGVEGDIIELAAGQDPTPVLGFGAAVAAAACHSRLAGSRHLFVKVPATTAGTISSITETPGGAPNITVTGSDFDGVTGSPFDAYNGVVRVAKTGDLGDCVVDVSLDGGTFPYTYDVPPAAVPTILGTVDLTTLTLSTLNTTTIKLQPTAPAAEQDVTLSTPTDVYDIAAQINAATTNITASIVGGKYLQISYDVGGASQSLQVLASSTADTILGLSNTAVNGGACTITLPGTGLTIAFAAGVRTKGQLYTFTTTAPRHSLADLETALGALNADPERVFGLLEVPQLPVDATDLRSYVAALDSVMAAWRNQENKRFVDYTIGAPLDVSDLAIRTAMAGHVSLFDGAAQGWANVAPRYLYQDDVEPMPQGRFSRSLARALTIRLASISLSEDPGNGEFGPLPECYLRGPAGELAPDENTATVKLGTSKGPGFTVVKSKDGQPYFVRGVTRAGKTSRFVDTGVARMSSRAATLVFAALRTLENKTFDLMPNGTLQERDAAAMEGTFSTMLTRELVRRKHASAVRVEVDRSEDISQTRNVTIKVRVQPRGQGEDLTLTLTLTGTIENVG